jgi:hypothetical protein
MSKIIAVLFMENDSDGKVYRDRENIKGNLRKKLHGAKNVWRQDKPGRRGCA